MSAVPAAAAGTRQVVRRTTGTTTEVRVRMVSQPWSATATVAPQPVKGPRHPQFIGHYPGYAAAKREANERRKKLLQSTARKKPSAAAATVAAASSAMVVFDGPNETDTPYFPPDSQVAAGPNDVVVAINTLLAIYDKTGAQQGGFQDLSNFFSSLNVTGQLTDPRVIYDQTDKRFILSIDDVDLTNFTSGHVLLAVSATSDPTGTWYKYAVDFLGRNAANTANTLPDFPGLGLSPTAVYLTTNQFEIDSTCLSNDSCSFSDSWIKVIGLPALLSGNSTLTITTFKDVQTAGGHLAFGIQPALSYGTPSAEFLVAADFSANPSTLLNLFSIPTSGTPTLASADLTVPSFLLPPDAPQPQFSSGIISNDFRTINAVWNNGSLWCGQNVSGASGEVAARWYQIALSDLSSASLTQSGDVTGAGAAYYPALGVDSGGAATMSFTTSSAEVPASAAYTGRHAADAAGTMRGYSIVKQGLGPYDETLGNRWGDYSGVSLDPSGTSFWTIAEYAGSPDPQFGTEIAQITEDPSLTVAPGSYDFLGVLIGQSSPAQTFTFTNTSANAVTLGTASLSGVNAADFSVSSDQCSGISLAAGQSCALSVTFTPSQQIFEEAYLSLSDQDGEVVASLSGYGMVKAILNFSPSLVNFPSTVQQGASAPISATLTNSGNLAADFTSIYAVGAFAETNNCGASLAAGASCQFAITFYPTDAANFTGDVYANLNGSAGPTLTLTGTGITSPAALFCPTALSFPNQVQGTASAAQSVILTNNGSDQLTITGIAITGDFAETNNCPGSLPARSSCQIDVTFTPTALGNLSGALTVTDDANGSPQSISLSGSGVSSVAVLRPQAQGTSSKRQGASAALHSQSSRRAARRLLLARRPLEFEPNVGQFRPDLRYVTRVPGYALGLTRTGVDLEMPAKAPLPAFPAAKHRQIAGPVRVQMRLAGANPNAHALGMDMLPGKANYFFGDDPSGWRTNVPTYARVGLRDVYPGIDLIYYGNQRRLEYDFVVRPGADPGRIRLRFAGASKVSVDSTGDLLLKTRAGVVRLHKPVVYQVAQAGKNAGERLYRGGAWVVRGTSSAAFLLAPYDRRETLVIDPVMTFSTYLGGSGGDTAYALASDGQGNAYVAGVSYSSDFPVTTNAFQKTCSPTQTPCQMGGMRAGFVAKLSSDGSQLLYATYLGGSLATEIHAIAVDSSGNAYVTGFTNASDFPATQGAFQTQCGTLVNTSECVSLFVTKLNPTGSSLVYSSYLSGSQVTAPESDTGTSIAVDSAGDAFVGGTVTSDSFPTTPGSLQPADPQPGKQHGTLSELNPAGSALVFSTYLGGANADGVSGLALDSSGNVYVTGATQSVNFPTTPGAFQRGMYSIITNSNQNAYIAKFSPSGSLLYSTFLGGTDWSDASAIAVDSAGAAYVTGQDYGFNSDGFPITAGAFLPTGSYPSAFATKLHPDACALVYSTFAPGGQGNAIAVDSSGDAYVAGTATGSIPSVNALQPAIGNAYGFLSELNPAGTALLLSTPLGGGSQTLPNALAVDSQGDVYVAGFTTSPDFPIANALEPNCLNCGPAVMYQGMPFVARISPAAATGVTLTRPSLAFDPIPVGGNPETEYVGLMNSQSVALNIQSVAVNGAGYTLPTSSSPCSGSIAPGAGCVVAVQFDPTAVGSQPGTVTITDDGPGSPRQVALNGTGLADFTLSGNPQSSDAVVVGTDSNAYSIYVQQTPDGPAFTGDVTLSCSGVSPATCTFDPSGVSVGSPSTLTVGNLTAVTGTSLSFTVVGTLGNQTFSLPLQLSFTDFSLSSSSTSASVTAGQAASYQIAATPIDGFNQNISFSCSGLPAYASCQFSSPTLTLDGKTTSKETVTISTTARGATPPGSPNSWPGVPLRPTGLWALALAILLLVALCSGTFRRRKVWLPVALVLVLMASISCGGGGGGTSTSTSGGGSGGSGGSVTGTPAGTYTVTVTGTAGPDSHAVKLTLTVQ